MDNSGTAVVLRLLSLLNNKGYILYTERLYTNIQLALRLDDLETSLVGTIMKNELAFQKYECLVSR